MNNDEDNAENERDDNKRRACRCHDGAFSLCFNTVRLLRARTAGSRTRAIDVSHNARTAFDREATMDIVTS